MMTTGFLIYLYIALGNLANILELVAALIILGIFAFSLSAALEDTWQNSTISRIWKQYTLAAVIMLSVVALYPSKEDMKYIIGGAVALEAGKQIVNNKEAQKLPDNVLKAMNTFLEAYQDKETVK